MKPKNVSPIEVIRTLYISDKLLSKVFKASGKGKQLKVKIALELITQKANQMSRKKLLKYHLENWGPRYDNYINSVWELKEIELKNCGVWPRMGKLPDKATVGTLMDTVEYIRPLLEDKRKLTLKTSRVLYIEELMGYAEEISKYIPIIVMQDHVIRHNKLRRASVMKLYKKTKYDIEDGNHRAVALALLGKKKVKALVGKKIYKSSLIYFD